MNTVFIGRTSAIHTKGTIQERSQSTEKSKEGAEDSAFFWLPYLK